MTDTLADVTVVTAAYSMDRWELTCRAVESALGQEPRPLEIIIPVDHNIELLERLRARWERDPQGGQPGIRVVPSRYDGHLGASATTAAELATTTFLLFLDDDAAAEPGWLASMLAPLADQRVRAVGGAPIPEYAESRPRWLPGEFNWVFGCAYTGLPIARAPVLHLIGTTMAVRRNDVIRMGGIRSDNHPDMEMCHKLLAMHPDGVLLYEPAATVLHHVPASRTTWAYFWRRVFSVNRSKVQAVEEMGEAGHLGAERGFVTRIAPTGVVQGVRDAARGDSSGLVRAGVIIIGVVLSGAGFRLGTLELWLRRIGNRPSPKRGW